MVAGVGTMFKKVVPVQKYSCLDEYVSIGEVKQQLANVLPSLVERYVICQNLHQPIL